jgi:hypothetical protein
VVGVLIGGLFAVAAVVGTAAQSRASAARSASASAMAPPPAPTNATPMNVIASLAHWRGERLYECIDVTATPDGMDDSFADRVASSIADEMAKTKGVTTLTKPCREQFSDRTALASCTIDGTDVVKAKIKKEGKTTDSGGIASLTVRTRFYDYQDLQTDHELKDCLKEGGEWKAVSKDSDEWKRARLEHDKNQLRQAVKTLEESNEP